jgi:hypothetical protein
VNRPRRNWLDRRSSAQHQPAARRWKLAVLILALAVVALAAAQLSGVFARIPSPAAARAGQNTGRAGNGAASLSAVAAARAEAARWIAQQVSSDAIVACDPVMCSALQAQGVGAVARAACRPRLA